MLEAWQKNQEAIDRRVGRLIAYSLEPHRNRKKRPMPYTETDFVPKKKSNRRMTGEQMEAMGKLICLANKGTIRKAKGVK